MDRIERNSFAGTGGWITGGAKGYVGPPPSQIIGGPGPPAPPPPLPTPMYTERKKKRIGFNLAYFFTYQLQINIFAQRLISCTQIVTICQSN